MSNKPFIFIIGSNNSQYEALTNDCSNEYFLACSLLLVLIKAPALNAGPWIRLHKLA